VQVPANPDRLQARQPPVHDLLQQTPCWQKPVAHSLLPRQAAPADFFTQVPPMQTKSVPQSLDDVHADRQVPLPPQAKGSQARVAPARQTPLPSQRRLPLSVPAVQLVAAHTVLEGYLRQAPAPLQVPSLPQVAAPLSAHWPSGSWPAGTVEQLPAVPGRAHDLQTPSQTVPQQVPCSQKAELHWSAVVQALPRGFLPQLPPTQVFGVAQSASVLQVVRHISTVPSQVNGAQDWVAVGTQAPLPSQREARFMFDPLQVEARQAPSVPQLARP
jgi:hypothetical protein